MLRMRHPHIARPDAAGHQDLQQTTSAAPQHTNALKTLAKGRRATTVLLVGLGNPIMGDDAVGISVVRILKNKIPARPGLEYKELSLSGLRLVEEILGYESVFIIDSVASSETTGKIRELSPEQFKDTEYASSPHSTNFPTALTLYKNLEPAKIPTTLRIFTIDINPQFTFSETLSPQIQRAASELAELIAAEIKHIMT